MEVRDDRSTYPDGDPPISVRGTDPVSEPGGYAELCELLEQAIRHLESSDFHSAGVKLERACNRAVSLWEANEAPGLTHFRTPQIRLADAGPVSEGPETTPCPQGPRGT